MPDDASTIARDLIAEIGRTHALAYVLREGWTQGMPRSAWVLAWAVVRA
jgi:hypothetical protein